MSNFLEMRHAYRRGMRSLESSLQQINDNPFYIKEKADEESLDTYFRNQETRKLINHIRVGYEEMGLRLGEKAKPEWLGAMTTEERKVFLLRYERKMGFVAIGKILGMETKEAHQLFKSALNKVTRTLKKEG
jgi:DNA-directed RNA polymerase specialized sigma24 family protein